MKKGSEVEKEWITRSGLKAVALFIDNSHRCGYVAVPKEHPFFGKTYRDASGFTLGGDTLLGKRSPMDIFIMAFAAEQKEGSRVGHLFDVHGGITYSSELPSKGDYPVQYDTKELWWFGFDCNHYNDLTFNEPLCYEREFRSLQYVVDECESLATQLMKYYKEVV